MLEVLCSMMLSALSTSPNDNVKLFALDFAIQTNYEGMLFKVLQSTDSGNVRGRALALLIRRLETADDGMQWRLISEIEEFGPDAKEATPALIEIVNRRGVRVKTVHFLWKGYPNTSVVESPFPNRDSAIKCLGVIGPDAKDALETLDVCLREDSYPIRFAACVAIHKIAPGTRDLKSILATGLRNNEQPQHQMAALRAVTAMKGEMSESQWFDVCSLLHSKNLFVRATARDAVQQIMPAGQEKDTLALLRLAAERVNKELDTLPPLPDNLPNRQASRAGWEMLRGEQLAIQGMIEKLEAKLKK